MRQIGKATINLVDGGRSGDKRIVKLRATCDEVTLEKSVTVSLDSDGSPGDAIEAEVKAFAAQVERVCDQDKLADNYILAF